MYVVTEIGARYNKLMISMFWCFLFIETIILYYIQQRRQNQSVTKDITKEASHATLFQDAKYASLFF